MHAKKDSDKVVCTICDKRVLKENSTYIDRSFDCSSDTSKAIAAQTFEKLEVHCSRLSAGELNTQDVEETWIENFERSCVSNTNEVRDFLSQCAEKEELLSDERNAKYR